MNDKNSILKLDNLTVSYGKTIAADSVNLSVTKGEVYALIGRNGAGKTSLIRCILGERKATSGKTLLFGEDSWKKRAKVLERVGVVPEDPDAPPDMTAEDLIVFCSRIYPSWNDRDVRERLEKFQIPMKLAFQRLSKGQKGHLLLAIALGPMPELLILDDPTLGLDAVARKMFFEELVVELADRETTIFMTSHDLAGVESIANHVGIMRESRLLVDEETEALKRRFRRISFGENGPSNGVQEALMEMKPMETNRHEWGTELVVSEFNEEAFKAFGQTSGIKDAEAVPMSLEEIFISLNGEGGLS